jgi:hypothetical protein
VSDKEFDRFDDKEFAQPYNEAMDRKTLYPVPREAMKTIGTHNPAGELENSIYSVLPSWISRKSFHLRHQFGVNNISCSF